VACEDLLCFLAESPGDDPVDAGGGVFEAQFLSGMADDPFKIAPTVFGEMEPKPAGYKPAEP
jgi:hypothetical protein